MTDVNTEDLLCWKQELEAAWVAIPGPFRNDYTVRRSLQCHLYGHLRKMGHKVVADYLPPRIQDRPIDLIAVGAGSDILYAICFDSVVTLAAVKSLMSFESANKIIFTTGLLEKKVQESRFFLKPEIVHLHVRNPQQSRSH